jgi:flagellar biosynthesis protein FlhG
MFADAARMVALFGDDEQEITAALALALAAQGKKILLLDEHLRAGDTHGLLPGPIRADIGHVLRGDKSLQEIVLQTSATGVTLMPAGVMRTVHKDSARVRLLAAFHALVGMFDIVLIRAATGNRPSFGFALGAPEAMVLCKGTSSGITAAYAQIKQAAHSPGSRHFRLLFRGVDAAMADVLFRNLAGVCRQHLNLMPDLAGVLPSDQTAAADAIEGLAAEIAHWPAPERDDSRFEAFMRRLLSVTGTFNPLTTEH